MYENYARIRDEKGLKDTEVARLSGVAQATISAWKNGEYEPKVKKLIAICKVLDCSINDLLFGGKESELDE